MAVVILAGGLGRRIGGSKPLRSLSGTRLIDRAAELARQWSPIVAVSVRDPDQVGGARLSCILDDAEIEGPLGGLAAALRYARGAGCETVLSIPVDMPFLPGDLAERLAGASADARAVIAASGGELHPVCGLWRGSSLDALPAYLATGRRSLRGFAEAIGVARVDWPIIPSDPFFNINSPDDLAVAEGRCGS